MYDTRVLFTSIHFYLRLLGIHARPLVHEAGQATALYDEG